LVLVVADLATDLFAAAMEAILYLALLLLRAAAAADLKVTTVAVTAVAAAVDLRQAE
jgi:hypothetical protein